MLKPIAVATAICGTLDIAFAMVLTLLFGRQVDDMLRFVASGPFPSATEMGAGGAVLGLVVHFALMAVMAAIFVIAARQLPELRAKPIRWGVVYGLVTYVAMNLIVVPVRFDAPLPPSTVSIATQLFAHIVLVAIPFALITARFMPPQRADPAATT